MDPYKNTEEFLKAELKKRILFMTVPWVR